MQPFSLVGKYGIICIKGFHCELAEIVVFMYIEGDQEQTLWNTFT